MVTVSRLCPSQFTKHSKRNLAKTHVLNRPSKNVHVLNPLPFSFTHMTVSTCSCSFCYWPFYSQPQTTNKHYNGSHRCPSECRTHPSGNSAPPSPPPGPRQYPSGDSSVSNKSNQRIEEERRLEGKKTGMATVPLRQCCGIKLKIAGERGDRLRWSQGELVKEFAASVNSWESFTVSGN